MTDLECFDLYNDANGLDPKAFNPITTQRIYAAIREAYLRGQRVTRSVSDEDLYPVDSKCDDSKFVHVDGWPPFGCVNPSKCALSGGCRELGKVGID